MLSVVNAGVIVRYHLNLLAQNLCIVGTVLKKKKGANQKDIMIEAEGTGIEVAMMKDLCIQQRVIIVGIDVRFHLNRLRGNQSIVVSVLKILKKVEVLFQKEITMLR